MKHFARVFGGFLFSAYVACAATLPPAAPDAPVELGQWHSNLAAATAKAKELGAPMLVIWGDPNCSYCVDFDKALNTAECIDYLANRGLVLVYEKSKASPATAVKLWTGYGDWPLLRLTWWQGQTTVVDYAWQRPNAGKPSPVVAFERMRTTIESKVGAYSPLPSDNSKDAYDPDNDTVGGAPTLVWGDQAKSESLKLAKKSDAPAYSDQADWFKFLVETGKTYKIWISGVSGISADVPQVALYGDSAGTEVLGGPEALANDVNFEGEADGDGTIYVKVWRTTAADADIRYTLSYQRFAPGQIVFDPAAVSVSESAASVTLTLKRVGGTTGAASVQIGYADSLTPDSGHTATAGEDFNGVPAPTTLSWADGDAANKTVTFSLIKNVVEWEGAETFGVTLAPVGDTLVGGPAVVTLLEVDALTTRAASYNGWVSAAVELPARTVAPIGPVSRRVTGTMTMSVSTMGRITGRVVFPRAGVGYSGNYTVQNATHQAIVDGEAVIAGELVQGRTRIPITLRVNMKDGSVRGEFGAGDAERLVDLHRDDWADPEMKQLAARLSGYYTVAFPVAEALWPLDCAPTGSGYAAITIDTRGRFRAAGKLGDGTMISQSGVLFVREGPERLAEGRAGACAMLFVAPATYGGGGLTGMLRFGDVNDNGVWDVTPSEEFPLFWNNRNPLAVSVYDAAQPGFDALLWATGGWYNRAENLNAFYAGKSLFVGELEEPLGYAYSLSRRDRNDAGGIVTTRSAETAPCVSWQAVSDYLEVTPKPDGTGFTVPAGDLVRTGIAEDGMPLYNYDTGVNPNRLRLAFNRTTGVMSGAFSLYYDYATSIDTTGAVEKKMWRHAFVNSLYAGILLQEQAFPHDGVTAYGFYQSSGRSSYRLPSGSLRAYSFKKNSEFCIHAVGAR